MPSGDDGVSPRASAAAGRLVAPQSGPGLTLDDESELSFDGLVDKSELVLTGTVKRVRTGAEIVDIDPKYPTRMLHAVVDVERVLKGPAGSREVKVATIESAYAPIPGARPEANLEWRRPGERIVAFLEAAPAGPGRPLVPTSYSQSFYRLEGDRVVPLAAQAAGAASMHLSDFEAARAAAN